MEKAKQQHVIPIAMENFSGEGFAWQIRIGQRSSCKLYRKAAGVIIVLSILPQPSHHFPTRVGVMWLKQCHKPPIWEWFIPPIYGDFGDGLLLFYQHYMFLHDHFGYSYSHDQSGWSKSFG